MRVDASVSKILTDSASPTGPVKQSLQVASLKKALDTQKPEPDTAAKMLQPKGRVIDIKV